MYSFDAYTMEHVFTLERGGEKKTYTFGDHTVSVNSAKKDELIQSELSNMIDAPSQGKEAPDGMIYYITARPEDVGRPSLIWLKSKEEAVILFRLINDAMDNV